MENPKSIIDSNGNIDTASLSKELREALDADVKYRQTDNMKKKAVKVSSSYDEFKARVACAHLKTLSSQEVESLSHVKKGWQKTVARDQSSSAHILNNEVEAERLNSQSSGSILSNPMQQVGKKPKPKNPMEMERDLRRLSLHEDKLRYLLLVGLKRTKSILAASADTDLIEQILLVLISAKVSLTIVVDACESDLKNEVSAANVKNESEEGITKDLVELAIEQDSNDAQSSAPADDLVNDADISNVSFDSAQLVKWLKALTEFAKFNLMIQFCSPDVIAEAVECLRLPCGGLKVKTAINRYQQAA